MVTWPSAAITTLLSRRTHNTVVPCIRAEFLLIGIQKIIPRAAAATNAGLKIGLRAVSVAALFDALDSPRILWAFARNYFRTCCH